MQLIYSALQGFKMRDYDCTVIANPLRRKGESISLSCADGLKLLQ